MSVLCLFHLYLMTKPYACDPSSLPKYPPNKEINAKNREDARRKMTNGRSCGNWHQLRICLPKLKVPAESPVIMLIFLKKMVYPEGRKQSHQLMYWRRFPT